MRCLDALGRASRADAGRRAFPAAPPGDGRVCPHPRGAREVLWTSASGASRRPARHPAGRPAGVAVRTGARSPPSAEVRSPTLPGRPVGVVADSSSRRRHHSLVRRSLCPEPPRRCGRLRPGWRDAVRDANSSSGSAGRGCGVLHRAAVTAASPGSRGQRRPLSPPTTTPGPARFHGGTTRSLLIAATEPCSETPCLPRDHADLCPCRWRCCAPHRDPPNLGQAPTRPWSASGWPPSRAPGGLAAYDTSAAPAPQVANASRMIGRFATSGEPHAVAARTPSCC